MHITHVIANRELIVLAQYMLQRVACIHIAECVRDVWHSVVIGHAQCSIGIVTLAVAHVLYGVVATYGEDVLIYIMYSSIESLSDDMTVVGAHSHSFGVDGTDDIILDVAVVETQVSHYGVCIGESVLIVEVKVDVIALLRLEYSVTFLIIAVTELPELFI